MSIPRDGSGSSKPESPVDAFLRDIGDEMRKEDEIRDEMKKDAMSALHSSRAFYLVVKNPDGTYRSYYQEMDMAIVGAVHVCLQEDQADNWPMHMEVDDED